MRGRSLLLELKPVWSPERMRTHHEQLVAGLEREGADVLRKHLQDGASSVMVRA